MPVGFEPMKGDPSDHIPEGEDWVYQYKYNGFRLMCGVPEDGNAWAEIGSNYARTTMIPYITDAMADLVPPNTILDGEVVALNPDGTQDWGRVQTIIRSTKKIGVHQPTVPDDPPLTFVVFDVLVVDGDDHRSLSFDERHEALEGLGLEVELDGHPLIATAPVFTDDPEAVYGDATEAGYEGIVARKRRGKYRCGRRSRDILKIKAEFTIDVVVTDIYDSNDSGSWLAQEDLPGKLGFGYWDEDAGEAIELSRVGTGFSKRQREDIRDNPDEWLDAVIEVRAWEDLDSGKVRHPAFVRRRDDKEPHECVRQEIVSAEKSATTAEVAGEPDDAPIASDPGDLPMSPARKTPGGRIRNVKQMGDKKFVDLCQQMIGSDDVKALKAVMEEARSPNRAHLGLAND